VGHALKPSGLLHLKASRDRVFQSGLKTNRGVMMDDARDIIAEVVSGCIGSFYLKSLFSMYYALGVI
jgi:hypothetical protein